MTVGQPDYGSVVGQVNEVSSTDVLELAARLNTPMMINRSGQLMGSIAECITYNTIAFNQSSNGSYCQSSTKYSTYDRPSLKCVTQAVASDYVGLQYNFLPFSSQQIGQAGLFIVGTFQATLVMQMFTIIQGTLYGMGIQVNLATGAWSLYNASQGWTSIGTLNVPTSVAQPFIFKYTTNLATGYYGKLFFSNEQMIDISSYKFWTSSGSGADNNLVLVTITNNGSTSQSIYISDIQLTINEVV
jgi:hypothetical protein